MTPKEKAKELVKEQLQEIYKIKVKVNFAVAYEITNYEEVAKQCALICVKKLKDQCMSFDYALSVYQSRFLEDVKQEIKKM